MKKDGISCLDIRKNRQPETPEDAAEIRWHLASCPDCHLGPEAFCNVLLFLPMALMRLGEIGTEHLDDWQEQAVRIFSEKEATQTLKHAENCGVCSGWKRELLDNKVQRFKGSS